MQNEAARLTLGAHLGLHARGGPHGNLLGHELAHEAVELLLGALGLPNGPLQVQTCQAMRAAASGAGDTWVDGQATRTSLEVSLYLARDKKRQKLEETELKQTKLRANSALQKPTSWKSTAYRRAEVAGDDKGKQKAEEKERARWGKWIMEIPISSGLHFGEELTTRGWDFNSPEASRCLRGLRAAILKKRTTDLEPLLRYLRAELAKPFPTTARDILMYFKVREEENAARTVYSTVLLALAFFEEAGEQPRGRRLADDPSLRNAAKEFETRRAKQQDQLGPGRGRGQAPPMLVALLAAIERVVNDQEQALFVSEPTLGTGSSATGPACGMTIPTA